MEILSSIADLRPRVRQWRRGGARIALVPTMGNLHRGHLSLVAAAREAADRVAVSLFVNPLQFGPHEDFSAYPRTIDEDIEKLTALEVDVLFAPEAGELYPRPPAQTSRVIVPHLSDILCGASRPGHFAGVATVVTILFNLVQPDVAVFGEKDFQQLLIIRRLVSDLHLPVTVLGAPTVRDPDGLALSSRNRYLSPDERRVAAGLYRSLCRARDIIQQRAQPREAVERMGRRWLEDQGFAVDYFTVRRAADLQEPSEQDAELVVLAAAMLGRSRLIDNIRVAVNGRA